MKTINQAYSTGSNSFLHCCYKYLLIAGLVILAGLPDVVYAQKKWARQKHKQYIILAEQSRSRVAIVDIAADSIVWEWLPANQADIQPAHVQWFDNMSDAKPVNNGKYILACASGGGIALIRIADKKTLFYAYAGGNTHSIALLPDGNIISASSTGNFLRVFVYNSQGYPDNTVHKDFYLHDGHNIVWSHTEKKLYTVSGDQFKTYRYNFNTAVPELTLVDSLTMPDKNAHDLYWSFDHRYLWSSTGSSIFKIHMPGKNTEQIHGPVTSDIKSISSGPGGYPTIIIQPKESWWTDEVLDMNGETVFKQKGLRIYKARWLL